MFDDSATDEDGRARRSRFASSGRGFDSAWKHASPSDLDFCRELLRSGSRTFHAAARVLPSRIRLPAAALYAFCRVADDAVDLDCTDPTAALASLHVRLDAVYADAPMDHPVDRAFADVVVGYGIPRELPAALLEGFAWDGVGRRYETLADLEAYGARVAGTVGAMMSVLMGVRAPHVLARACDLGVAMQLTNIARDVGEDARAGRLYLPLQWLREAGVDPDGFLARPIFTPALGRVIERLIAAAEPLYARAADGIAALPPGCRAGMDAARRLYAEIGAEVARRGYDSVSTRAVVPATRKSRLLLSALGATLDATRRVPGPQEAPPPLPAVRHLVDAVAVAPAPDVVGTRGFADGVVWMLVLFEQLERRDHAGTGGGHAT